VPEICRRREEPGEFEMKRLLLASLALSALTEAEIAAAGDVPPEVIYPAGYPVGSPLVPPVVAPRFTFTGFYVGGTVGGAAGSSKYSETPSGPFMTAVPPFPFPTVPSGGTQVAAPLSNIASVGKSSTAPRGVIGGIEVGYNWQIGHFVVGFETDFSGWDLSSSAGVVGAGYPGIEVEEPIPKPPPNTVPCPNNPNVKFPKCPSAAPGTAFTSTTSTSSNWLFTARPRFGFANGNQLLYVTGGLAVSDISFAQSIVVTGYGQRPGTGPTLAGAASSTQVGWTAGFGIEYALSWNWLIKAEYLYVSFPNQSAAQVAAGAPASTGTVTDKLSASIARAGFDYRF
jgi:outer membrane immunogenic protein